MLTIQAALGCGGARAASDAAAHSSSQSAPVVGWAGPYVGLEGSAGAFFTKYRLSSSLGAQQSSGFGGARPATSFVGGAYAGYNLSFGRVLVGFEADFAARGLTRTLILPGRPMPAAAKAQNQWGGAARLRTGRVIGGTLLYGAVGPAFSRSQLTPLLAAAPIASERGRLDNAVGLAFGAGVETTLNSSTTLGAEYRRTEFAASGFSLNQGPGRAPFLGHLRASSDEVTARLSWYPAGLGVPGDVDRSSNDANSWSVHGQSTFIQEAVPGFSSPYAGPNSLLPHQARETWTNTLFLGVRVWPGTEFYFNPEFTQGFGPSGTLGLAGFSNGEAAKAGFTYPRFRPQRYFVRQTFGLGGEQDEVKDAANQVAGMRDIDRFTVTAGKLSVIDIFDDNVYSHDPRINFLNGAMFTSAAYDYPANLAGYTYGIVTDLNHKMWAVRAGLFQVPKAAGSDELDTTGGRGGVVAEVERRYAVFDLPGKLRLGAFLNRTFSGSYREALLYQDVNAGIVATRETRSKAGFYVGVEQSIADDLGLFGRVSWNDGRNEIVSYTDVDRSLSAGLSFKGTRWSRPNDVVGLGGAVNALAPAHREFLADGGIGLLIGDGRLRYGPEQIAEAYYAIGVTPALTLTFDYQLIGNPAYNRDRGPASVASARFHIDY